MDYFTTDETITIGTRTLIPVVHIHQATHYFSCASWFMARKETIALIICDVNGITACDMNAAALTVEDLTRLVPGLIDLIRPYH